MAWGAVHRLIYSVRLQRCTTIHLKVHVEVAVPEELLVARIPCTSRCTWYIYKVQLDIIFESSSSQIVSLCQPCTVYHAGGAGAAGTRTYGWQQFQMCLGTANAPNILYINLSVESGGYSRVFNDALSCVGKVNGLRATEWSYDEFCAQTSANSVAYPTAAAGVVADLADKVVGGAGGLIMQRDSTG
jgi:hypothetical protein